MIASRGKAGADVPEPTEDEKGEARARAVAAKERHDLQQRANNPFAEPLTLAERQELLNLWIDERVDRELESQRQGDALRAKQERLSADIQRQYWLNLVGLFFAFLSIALALYAAYRGAPSP